VTKLSSSEVNRSKRAEIRSVVYGPHRPLNAISRWAVSYLLCDGVDEPDVQVLLLTDTCNNNTRMRTTHSAVAASEQPARHSDGTRSDRSIKDYRIICPVTRQNYIGLLSYWYIPRFTTCPTIPHAKLEPQNILSNYPA